MDSRIHRLEEEAYAAVLRAFAAQSKFLSWEKVEMMTELRLQLQISDTHHREILSNVCSENGIELSRNKRKGADARQPSEMKQQPSQRSSPHKRLKSASLVVKVEKPNEFDSRLANGNTKDQSKVIEIRSNDKIVHQVSSLHKFSNQH
ncbi:hypothetical protein HPP92_005506 [Vanilla planifolia]|uniref:ENT domain-containing protein n=1 Tax=Vanilla planifolia TaxID=51239 RepID=A0A835VD93_VANPL|nr:hypothetical protein HPP92_005506 [Vanilla planifolia]